MSLQLFDPVVVLNDKGNGENGVVIELRDADAPVGGKADVFFLEDDTFGEVCISDCAVIPMFELHPPIDEALQVLCKVIAGLFTDMSREEIRASIDLTDKELLYMGRVLYQKAKTIARKDAEINGV